MGACGQAEPGDCDPGGRHGGQVSTSGNQGKGGQQWLQSTPAGKAGLRPPGPLVAVAGPVPSATPLCPEELTQWNKRSGLDHLRNHQA